MVMSHSVKLYTSDMFRMLSYQCHCQNRSENTLKNTENDRKWQHALVFLFLRWHEQMCAGDRQAERICAMWPFNNTVAFSKTLWQDGRMTIYDTLDWEFDNMTGF